MNRLSIHYPPFSLISPAVNHVPVQLQQSLAPSFASASSASQMYTRPVDTVQRHKNMALQLPPILECGETLGEDRALKNVKPEKGRKPTSKVRYPGSVIKPYLSWKRKFLEKKIEPETEHPYFPVKGQYHMWG
jgi:hypothetical protein